MSTIKNRLKKAFGANLYAQSVGLIVQLLTIPFLLNTWGLEQFGVWTYCVAISVYFGLTDFGFMAAGMNRVSTLAFGGLQFEAQRMISSLWKLFAITLLVVLMAASLILFSGILEGMNVRSETGRALFFLIANALIAMSSSIFDSIFRANNEYSKGTALLETIRLIEWLALIGSAAIGGGVVEAAFAVFLARLVCTSILFIYIEIYSNNKYRNSVEKGQLSILYGLRNEAISWCTVRYGESIALQGPIILAANLIGPTAAALLSSYRTISRAALQFSALIGNSLWPEFSRAMALEDKQLAKMLLVKSTLITFCGSVVIAMVIFAGLDQFLSIWGRGKIPINAPLLGLFFLGVVATATWYPARIFLMASTALKQIGPIYLFLNIVGVTTLAFTLSVFGEYSVPIVGLIIEVIVGYLVWKIAMQLVRKNV